ncbi:YidH family protein [Mycobacterium sp. Dal123C01]|uniref:YidH family protein n=1 Tax=Mycobacterium sp. Dal123C01 TaxID=3457577 RepID=UPI00403E652F
MTPLAPNSSQPGQAQPQDGTVEPDYRFTLANERTFLAWQRTSLGLLAAAVAAVQFMPELPIHGMRHTLGAMVGTLAMLTAGTGLQRWVQVDRAIRHGQPLPRPTTPVYLAVGLVMIGMVTVVVTIATTGHG